MSLDALLEFFRSLALLFVSCGPLAWATWTDGRVGLERATDAA